MKKKIVAIVLAVVMLFSVSTLPASAAATDGVTNVLMKVIDSVLNGLVGALVSQMKENDNFVPENEYVYDNFYEGTEAFISEAQEGAQWSLGKASESLVPENLNAYELYLGGFINEQNFFTNDVREVLDDMKVRVVALNDGSERGTAVFATIDSIGIANADIRTIRAKLSDFAKEKDINSINIFATHTHSGIDTQGLWTDILGKWPYNIVSALTGRGELKQGTDPKYMQFLFEKVSKAIEDAVSSMEEGEMTYAEKNIGDKYFSNKNRPTADALDTKLRRFAFYPANKSVRPTIILNMSAHPDVVGLPTSDDPTKGHAVSGDYVYYIGETLNGAGYDFMFFNGAICGIYIGRIDVAAEKRVDIAANYGREIGKMTLGLTMTEEEIRNDAYLMGLNFTPEQTQGHWYVPWYENWTPAAEKEVEPILNIKLEPVEIEVTNPIIMLAGKAGLVNYLIKVAEDGKYYITSEIGYIEIGKDAKIAMVPGELCADLVYGGSSLTAEGSVWGKDFEGKTFAELFGEDVIVFGLANDAIGYIVPDNDYCMCLGFGHYHESISLGRKTASTLMNAFEVLSEEVK